jgi:hypothetical protein
VVTGAMSAELQKLHRRAVVLTTHDHAFQETAVMMAYELHRQLRIPHWSITMSPHKPENFLAQFDYPEQRDAALRAGSFYVGPSCFFIHPWRLDSHTSPAS